MLSVQSPEPRTIVNLLDLAELNFREVCRLALEERGSPASEDGSCCGISAQAAHSEVPKM
jgi:hypothetical protein